MGIVMPWNVLLAVLASGTFLARLLPQPIRTWRTGQVAGVSALAVMNALIADGAWLAYGLAAGVLAVWLVSIPALAASGWTLFLLRRTVGWRDAIVAAGWLAVVGLCALTGTLTAALSLTVLVCGGPAVWSAFSSPTPVGVSRWTWWLAVADAASWGGYGLAIGDMALKLYGVVLLVTAVAILVRLGPAGVPVGVPVGGPARRSGASVALDEQLGQGRAPAVGGRAGAG